MRRGASRFANAAAAIVAFFVAVGGAGESWAQRAEHLPKDLEGVGIDEALGASLPAGLAFRDEAGKPVSLGSYFTKGIPVLLVPHYSNCPMLCNLVVGGLVRALRQIEWNVGEKFEVVAFSIDPEEAPERSARTKERYLKEYGRPETAGGWHFLTGDAAAVSALTEAIGFRYRYVEDRAEYAHAAAVLVVTPSGKVARYLYGVDPHPQTVRLSLVEASEGKISSPVDTFLLFCFHYDAEAGRYAPVAMNIMRAGAALTAVVLLAVLGPRWVRDYRKRRGGEEEVYV